MLQERDKPKSENLIIILKDVHVCKPYVCFMCNFPKAIYRKLAGIKMANIEIIHS